MIGFVFLFCLLFRWGILPRVLLVVGWCWVLYSSGFLCVSFHYFILPRVSSLVSLGSWSQCFLSKGSGFDLWSGMKIPQVVCYGIAAAAAKSLQSRPTLCDPIDGSPPGSPTPGILQARTLEWVTISFSNACKWKVKVKTLSCVRLLATPWTIAYQAPLSMGFSRQEYWSGVPLPSLKKQV